MTSQRTVHLMGEAGEVGRRLGCAQKELLRSEIEERAQAEAVSAERVRALRETLSRIAPWWIAETEGLAEAAGVQADRLFEFAAAPYKRPAYVEPGDCTSALAMGDVTATGRPILLKIRDEKPRPQYVAARRIEGVKGILYGSNVLNLGVAYVINEDGLAIGNDTGSPIPGAEDPPGLDDCMLTRLLAETCADCDEAETRVCDLCREGVLRGAGWRKGTILLLADAKGEGRIIEISERDYTSMRVEKGFVAVANHFVNPESKRFEDAARMGEDPCKSSHIRRDRMDALLRTALSDHPLTPEDFERISRDGESLPYALCNPTDTFPWRTIGAFIFSLTATPDVRFVIGPPTEGAYTPADVNATATPLAWLRREA